MRVQTPQKRKLSKTDNPVASADLLASPLFRQLDSEPELLEALRAGSQFFECSHEYKLIGENGDNQVLMLIHSGCVKICRWVDGTERVIGYLEQGSVVGEIHLLNRLPHTADVVAEGDMIGIEIAPETFLACLPSSELLYRNLARSLATKICDNDARVIKREQGNYAGKHLVALAIEDMIGLHGFQADGKTIDLQLTHERLAYDAAFSRQTATAAINDLKALGIISNENKRIKVLDRERLNLYAADKISPPKH